MKQIVRFIMITVLMSVVPAAQLYAEHASAQNDADGAYESDADAAHKGCCQGAAGPRGSRGAQGDRGAQGTAGVAAYAEYVSTNIGVNTNMSANQAFTLGTLVIESTGFNTLINPHVAHGGTTFTFPTGRYVLNYEVSIVPTSGGTVGATVAVYMGNTGDTNLTMQEDSLAGNYPGADVANVAWVHGRHIIEVTAEQETQDVYIGTVIGDANINVATTGTNGVRMVRLTILQLA